MVSERFRAIKKKTMEKAGHPSGWREGFLQRKKEPKAWEIHLMLRADSQKWYIPRGSDFLGNSMQSLWVFCRSLEPLLQGEFLVGYDHPSGDLSRNTVVVRPHHPWGFRSSIHMDCLVVLGSIFWAVSPNWTHSMPPVVRGGTLEWWIFISNNQQLLKNRILYHNLLRSRHVNHCGGSCSRCLLNLMRVLMFRYDKSMFWVNHDYFLTLAPTSIPLSVDTWIIAELAPNACNSFPFCCSYCMICMFVSLCNWLDRPQNCCAQDGKHFPIRGHDTLTICPQEAKESAREARQHGPKTSGRTRLLKPPSTDTPFLVLWNSCQGKGFSIFIQTLYACLIMPLFFFHRNLHVYYIYIYMYVYMYIV